MDFNLVFLFAKGRVIASIKRGGHLLAIVISSHISCLKLNSICHLVHLSIPTFVSLINKVINHIWRRCLYPRQNYYSNILFSFQQWTVVVCIPKSCGILVIKSPGFRIVHKYWYRIFETSNKWGPQGPHITVIRFSILLQIVSILLMLHSFRFRVSFNL